LWWGDYQKGGWTVSIFFAHFVAKKIGGKATLLPNFLAGF
jgi:hypothetical protein